jgi:hypothetical protein
MSDERDDCDAWVNWHDWMSGILGIPSDAASEMSNAELRDVVERQIASKPTLKGPPLPEAEAKAKNPHYYKDVSYLHTIDVYRVLHLFGVTDPCLQHAVKKLLVTGGRAGGKDAAKDVKEAIYSLQRFQEMRAEEIT